MSPRLVADAKKDDDKSRAELIAELKTLRSFNLRLMDVVKRHQMATGKNDVYRSLLEETNANGDEFARDMDALLESEEMFRTLADSSHAGIILIQGDKIVYLNQALADMGGYTVEESLNKNFLEFIHPDFREMLRQRASASQGERRIIQSRYEVMIVKKDGGERWLDFSPGLIMYNGKPALIVTAIDITERKRAEKAVRASEANLARAEHMARLGHWSFDLVTGEISGSKELFDIYAVDSDGGWFYDTFVERVHPDDLDMLENADKEAIETGKPVNIDYRIVLPDGSLRFIHSEGEVKYDPSGKPVELFGIAQDITERKRAEEALRESEENFRVLADTSYAAIFVHRGSRFLYTNNMVWSITGYSRDELVKMYFWDLVHPDCEELVKSRAFARLNGEVVPSNYEIKIITRAGKIKWVYLATGLIVFHGAPAVIATLFDITERKQAEEELKATKAHAELYLDLMGHDINNMHQIALGYLELAEGMMPVGDSQREFIEKPIEALQRSARLIKNVRKLQKLQDGAFLTQDVDVCKVLVDVQREYVSVPGKAVTLNMNGCEHCLVRANELLYDVLVNLVSNAIKHTGDQTEIAIDLSVEDDDGGWFCRVSVEDNGPGIPDDFKGNIFNRMLKGTDKAKGIGIGLYLVKSLVESYGGRVWVEDRVPRDHTKGARFVVMLPAVEK